MTVNDAEFLNDDIYIDGGDLTDALTVNLSSDAFGVEGNLEGEDTNNINDGGDDIYDDGNYISSQFEQEIDYTFGSVSNEEEFGVGSSFATAFNGSIFTAIVTENLSDSYKIDGNLGSDDYTVYNGQSDMVEPYVLEGHRGFDAVYYVSQQLNDGPEDPGTNRIVMFNNSPEFSVSANYEGGDDDESLLITGLSNSSILAQLNIWSDMDNTPSLAQLQSAFENYVDTVIYAGGEEVSDIATMISSFEASNDAIATDAAIELFVDFAETGDLEIEASQADTTFNSSYAGYAKINAAAMADGTTLTLSSAGEINVDNANGSITIEGNDDTLGSSTGELIIVAADDGEEGVGDTLVVNTGSNHTSIRAVDADDMVNIDADAMSDGKDLRLIGAADMNVDNANGSISIEGISGKLDITVDDDGEEGVGDNLSVITGFNDTYIVALDSDDLVNIDAGDMLDGKLLNLSGEAHMDVGTFDSSIYIDADGGEDGDALTGNLNVIVDDDNGEDIVKVDTGSNNTTIDTADDEDFVVIDAEVMADDTTLTLIGAADMNVDNANGSISIEGNSETDGPLEGQLYVYSDDDGEDGAGDTLVVNTGTSDIQTIAALDADDSCRY